jgi:curli production assembly/transport component CsgG
MYASFRHAALAAFCLLAAGCVAPVSDAALSSEATFARVGPVGRALAQIPPPERPLDVAVYSFPDLTGQHKPNVNFTEYSRAVTQGGAQLLVDSLVRAGGGRWFNVVERIGLDALLQERQIITVTRQQYEGPLAMPLAPMRFAGLIIEGGIVGYDTNLVTGGAGARFLGIGASTEHRRDEVTVSLRAVSVQSGQVITSTTTTKTIYSVLLQAGLYRFVSTDEILEAEAGFSRNEPRTFAVREAIDLAVYALILEGIQRGLWNFESPAAAAPALADYQRRRGAVRAAARDTGT